MQKVNQISDAFLLACKIISIYKSVMSGYTFIHVFKRCNIHEIILQHSQEPRRKANRFFTKGTSIQSLIIMIAKS